MSKPMSMSMTEIIRMVLVLALVFLGSLILVGLIGAPIITILVYFYWQSRRRVKSLEKQIADASTESATVTSPPPPPESFSPSSTDA